MWRYFNQHYECANSETNRVQKSTCANLKANNLQSQLKFLSMLVSGVVSCKCARHDMYRPGATVDLKKGERFVCDAIVFVFLLTVFEALLTPILRFVRPYKALRITPISSAATTLHVNIAKRSGLGSALIFLVARRRYRTRGFTCRNCTVMGIRKIVDISFHLTSR